jgi:hypothetical protein
MSYGYDSLVAFTKSEIELRDVAADLLNRLKGERNTSEVTDANQRTTDTRADTVD